jgi:GDP-4-dehydro-6-deoxy-D-mannose reductase
VPGPPLVTGATGFAGSHLLDHLLERPGAIAAWAHTGGRPPRDSAGGRILWDTIDLLDAQAVSLALESLRPSSIYHCAGIAHVGASWAAPLRALEVNVLGTHHLLDAVRRTVPDCPVLVTGSALIYRQSAGSIGETDPIGPSSPYGVSKLAQEMLAARSTDAPVFIARPFNHAGPRQDETFVTSSFARQIAEIEAGRQAAVISVGNLDAVRDFTDVRDVVRAYLLAATHGEPGRAYNICSGRGVTIGAILRQLCDLSRVPIEVVADPDRLRPADVASLVGDPTRFETRCGWRAEVPLTQTITDLLDHWRERLASPSP